MNKISRIIALISIVVSIVSCDEDPNQLGIDLLPPTDDIYLKADSSTSFNFSTVLYDTVLTHNDYFDTYYYNYFDTDSLNLLGDYEDNIYGKKNADLLIRLMPRLLNTDSFPDNAHADSLILYLKVNSILLGNKNSTLKYNIYKVIKDIYATDSVYSSDDLTSYKGDLLESGSFNLNSDSIRIALNSSDLKNKLINLSYKQTGDSIFLTDILKGFYINVEKEDPKGVIATLNTQVSNYASTRLTLYYNDSLKFNFYARQIFNGAFTLRTNQENTIAATETDHVYIQGMVGPYTRINLNDPYTIWKDSGLVAINKAELIIKPDYDYLSSLNIGSSGYPKTLNMYFSVPNSSGKSIKYNIADANYKNGVYTFNLTSFYQQVLRNKMINYSIYISDGNKYLSTGFMAIKKTGDSKLRILYSKLE